MHAINTAGGNALLVNGRANFARSGFVNIPAGSTSATVTPAAGLTTGSIVLATMQNTAGAVLVKAAVPDPSAGTFKIILNQAPASGKSAKVGWFVVN